MGTTADKAADLLMMQYGLAGIVILALSAVVVVLWRQTNAQNKAAIDLTEKVIGAIERQTSNGLLLLEMRDKHAKMAEEGSRAIMALVSLTERENERSRESHERVIAALMAHDQRLADLGNKFDQFKAEMRNYGTRSRP